LKAVPLVVRLRDGACTGLARVGQFVGYRGDPAAPSVLLLRNNNLHIEIKVDRTSLVGRNDPAGIADIVLEAAVTTIMDLEDSVAAVDAEDKVALYRNWLGLMEGTLTASFEKGEKTIQRRLNPDRVFVTPDGGELRPPGRSLMLIQMKTVLCLTNEQWPWSTEHSLPQTLSVIMAKRTTPKCLRDGPSRRKAN
jgi:malate synthase